jgi:hypothetical protein
MTRITDFGRKRTYIEAGFASEPLNSEPTPAPAAAPSAPGPATEDTAEKPAKKKRKRTPKSKRDNYGKDKPAAASTDDAAPENATAPADTPDGTSTPPPDGLSKRKLWKKEKAKQWREKSVCCPLLHHLVAYADRFISGRGEARAVGNETTETGEHTRDTHDVSGVP